MTVTSGHLPFLLGSIVASTGPSNLFIKKRKIPQWYVFLHPRAAHSFLQQVQWGCQITSLELAYSEQDLTPPECPKSKTPVCCVQFYKYNLHLDNFILFYFFIKKKIIIQKDNKKWNKNRFSSFLGLFIIVLSKPHIFLWTPEMLTYPILRFISHSLVILLSLWRHIRFIRNRFSIHARFRSSLGKRLYRFFSPIHIL